MSRVAPSARAARRGRGSSRSTSCTESMHRPGKAPTSRSRPIEVADTPCETADQVTSTDAGWQRQASALRDRLPTQRNRARSTCAVSAEAMQDTLDDVNGRAAHHERTRQRVPLHQAGPERRQGRFLHDCRAICGEGCAARPPAVRGSRRTRVGSSPRSARGGSRSRRRGQGTRPESEPPPRCRPSGDQRRRTAVRHHADRAGNDRVGPRGARRRSARERD